LSSENETRISQEGKRRPMEKIKWTRKTAMDWIQDYTKATAHFNRMERDEKLEILEIIRSTYPENHRQLPAIDAQIERIKIK
jgi:hypothetical protein